MNIRAYTLEQINKAHLDELVHCKDCIHRNNDYNCHYLMLNGIVQPYEEAPILVHVSPGFACIEGKRKESQN